MDVKDWGFAASALVAAYGYWAKTKHERRKATRTALFYLLEMDHLVRRLRGVDKTGAAKLVSSIKKALELRGGVVPEAEADFASQAIQTLLQSYMRQQLKKLASDVAEPFAKALADLAKEDPILAFRLRGRDRLLTLSQDISELATVQISTGNPIDGISHTPAQIAVDQFFLEATSADLQYALKATAWRCDLITLVCVRRMLRRADRLEQEDMEDFFAEMAEKVVSKLELPVPVIARGQ